MSFGLPPTQLNTEAAEAKLHESEEKAARYAQQHPDYDGRGSGRLRRLLRQVRAAFSRRSRPPGA